MGEYAIERDKYITELPDDYPALVQVGSLQDLFKAKETVGPEVNVIIWRRGPLSGDFNGLANVLGGYTESHTHNHCDRSLDFAHYTGLIQKHCDEGRIDGVMEALAQVKEDSQILNKYLATTQGLYCVGPYGYRGESDRIHADGREWVLIAPYTDPATGWIVNSDATTKCSGTGSRKDVTVQMNQNAIKRSLQPGDVIVFSGVNRSEENSFLHWGRNPPLGDHKLLYHGFFPGYH